MRFPSFTNILKQTATVFGHHPLELLAAFTGTYAAVQLTFKNPDDFEHLLARILMTAGLAISSFLAVTLRGRFRKYSIWRRVTEYAVVAALLLLFFISIHEPPMEKDFVRLLVLGVASHLLVACAGFLGRGSTHAFWQFNRYMFLRIITAVIFSGVLFAGLAGAIAALHALFGLDFRDEWYGRLFLWIAGIFNTIFFFAGIPEDAEALEREHDYPKVLKVFTQFVLVPLVTIYLLILLAYEAKIIVQWQLPNGWVSNLIIAYGIAGILSILLVYPIRSMEDNRWIRLFSRWFYILLLPLIILMFVAIGVRIGHYGFTEQRVFVLALAIWLGCISFYYLLRPNGDIRIIPASLALLALVLSISAFEIGRSSQRNRLEQLLGENKMLSNGKAVAPPKGQSVSFKENQNISTTTEYLLAHHGAESVQPWFDTVGLRKERWSSYENTAALMKRVGLQYVSAHEREEGQRAIKWREYSISLNSVSITDYDEFLRLDERWQSGSDTGLHVQRTNVGTFSVYRNKERISPVIAPANMIKALHAKYGDGPVSDPADMQVIMQGRGCRIRVCYYHISGSTTGPASGIGYDGAVFLKWE